MTASGFGTSPAGDRRPERGVFCFEDICIITRYDPPPIPLRQFDWTAVDDNYDEGSPVGFGRTEQEAIEDLRREIEFRKD